MTFGSAIECLKDGRRVCRKEWKEIKGYLELKQPTEKTIVTEPFLMLSFVTEDGDRVKCQYDISLTDILADDWDIKPRKKKKANKIEPKAVEHVCKCCAKEDAECVEDGDNDDSNLLLSSEMNFDEFIDALKRIYKHL